MRSAQRQRNAISQDCPLRDLRVLRGLRGSCRRLPLLQSIRRCRALVVFYLVVQCSAGSVIYADLSDSLEMRLAAQERFREVAARIRPSLVRIETVGGTQPLDAPRALPTGPADDPSSDGDDAEGPPRPKPLPQSPFRETLGSRFVIADGPTTGLIHSSDGYIITSSFHFVRDPALITVTLWDGRRLIAELVARDQVRKLALLKVEADGLPVPEWVERRRIRVGQWAIALGLGFGGDEASLTIGVVSALGRMQDNAIQTDAKLSPANYGGPLVDIHGRVMGIAVPMAQRPGELAGIELYDAGVGFVLPKDRIDRIVSMLMTGESIYRGWLGVSVDPRSRDALVILNVAEPSPMYEAGVLPGDQILKINDKEVKHFGHLVQAIYMIPAGEPVRLEMDRAGGKFEVDVVLARSADLGPMPVVEEPFDPSTPLPESTPPEDELPEVP